MGWQNTSKFNTVTFSNEKSPSKNWCAPRLWENKIPLGTQITRFPARRKDWKFFHTVGHLCTVGFSENFTDKGTYTEELVHGSQEEHGRVKMLPVAFFALQPTQAAGAPFQGTGGVAKTHLHSQCCVRYSGYTLGPPPCQGLCSFRWRQGVKPVQEWEPQVTWPPAAPSGRRAPQDLGASGQRIKLTDWPLPPACQAPIPQVAPVCPEKKASTDGN